MATLGELIRSHTTLTREDTAHLHQLVSEWGMLADFCFSDLLLHVQADDGRWLVVAQVRPATGQTIYHVDWVGTWLSSDEQTLIERAVETGEIVSGEIVAETTVSTSVPAPERDANARQTAIPVRREGRAIAVLTQEWSNHSGRQPGELERTYQAIFRRFAAMIADGGFPFDGKVADSSAAPRVGDGVMVLDADARVEYASPNAVSALHRVGISANAVGQTLAELGFIDSPVRQAYERHEPVIEEFEQTADVTLLARCLPILAAGAVTGGVLLIRDVTELRRRDRLLLSKDATIREIHHRVKNNLQTISSLLRLQARRLSSPEAKAAVAESVRRIRTIALVHETLSREPGEDVAFIEIVRPLMRLAEEGLQSPDRPVRFVVHGDGGRLPATIATPLSVVLTELLQNAVDHGFPEGSAGGTVVVQLANDEDTLRVRVVNDGRGLDPGFDLDTATGLGLSIVRTLVTTELGGTIEMRPGAVEDFVAAGLADVRPGDGAVVDLVIGL